MIDIEIKPPKDLNGTYICYCPECDYENVWHKYARKNIDRICYSKTYEVYYATFEDGLKRAIVGYE